jgi:cell fate regulator YaaT (PSP1 superfamily)
MDGTEKEQRPKRAPAESPDNLAEQFVAESLIRRESKCSASCGSGHCGTEGGCATGGCGVASLVEEIANAFDYDDDRDLVEITYEGYRRGFAVLGRNAPSVSIRDLVIVRHDGGEDWAHVSMTGSLVHAKRRAKRLSGERLPIVLRIANDADEKRIANCKASERQAYSVCKTRIAAFELPMELVAAEWQFDHKKLTFFFTADGRVDFRELVRDLAAIFNTRIELRQIPVRDAAKRLGGMGVCGRELCCTSYLGRYEHVTLDHARIQQISQNPSKLSGQCGRLKCCLLYEIDTYVEGMKKFPKVESTVKTATGTGTIQKIDLFKEKIYLYHDELGQWETISLDDYREYRAGRTPISRTEEKPVESARIEPDLTSGIQVIPENEKRKKKKRRRGSRSKRNKGGSKTGGKDGSGTSADKKDGNDSTS